MKLSVQAQAAPRKHGKEAGTADTAVVVFVINGEKKKVRPAKLANDKFAASLQRECDRAEKAVQVKLARLLDLPDAERWAVLDFVAGLRRCRAVVGKDGYDGLFEAVLNLPVDPGNVDRLRNWKLAALEAAVLLYPDALEVPCNQVQERLRAVKVKGVRIADLVKEARQIVERLRSGAVAAGAASTVPVREVLPDAPVPPEVVVPAGWRLSTAGVDGHAGNGPGLTTPVVIAERGWDAHRGTELVTLAWHRDGRWHRRVVDRRQIADQRAVIDLAASGLAVTSINARSLVQYLNDFEAVNLKHLPAVRVSHKMGWQGEDGQDGFLWGRNLITAGQVFEDGDPSGSATGQAVRFRGADEGDDQLADGFRASGTFEGWLKAVKPLRHHPRALLGLYASFVPPLLPILGSSNHVVDFAGQTTSGKTTALRVIASVWGNPDERSRGAVLSTWNSTTTWRERVPAVCCHLPLILDDTKNIRFPEEVAKSIYGVVQGRARGRGTVNGIAHQDYCVTVLFSSGEQPATSFTKDGGTRPRVLSFWGSPFGDVTPAMAKRIRRINRSICENYGHAGPRFVRYLLNNRDQWDHWRGLYEQDVKHFEEAAAGDTIVGRMAAHFAAITVASWVVHQAFELPWEWGDPVAAVWDDLTATSGEADVAANALRLSVDWAVAHRQEFYHLNAGDRDQPHTGWAGRWDKDQSVVPDCGSAKWPYIGILHPVLEKLLREHQYDYAATVKTWKDRGWLDTDDEGRNTKRVKIGKDLARVVAIRREAVEAMNGDD